MKYLAATILSLTVISMTSLGQSPQAFKFQAVLRNGNGTLISDQDVGVRISILKTSIDGPSVYQETHKTISNENGVIILNIGEGSPSEGSFEAISWGGEEHFVKIELDQKNTGAFEFIGISQLLSVPYALYALQSGDHDWNNVANGISYQEGNVGINKLNPMYKLDVSGPINASSYLINGSPITPAPWNQNLNNVYFNSGNVGIGTSIPSTKLEINGGNDLNLLNLRNENNSLGINTYVSSNIDFHGSALIGRRSRGTYLSPQTVLEGDRISGIYGSLFANGNYQNSAAVHFYVGTNPGIGSYPSNIRFETTASGEIDRKERMRITENGNIGIGNINPMYNLDVAGTINANALLVNGNPISPGPWLKQLNSIYFNTGNIGIGTTAPATKLEINGGSDLNLLNLRNENNSLGINAYVSSNIDFHGSALIGRRSRGTYLSPQTVLEGDRISGIYGSLFADGDFQNSSAVHFYVGPSPGNGSYPSNIRFETTASGEIDRKERMRITDKGNVEIKTGDIYIEDIHSGVIMKSPNGQCWRMTIDNTGSPVFDLISCPN